MNRDNLTFNHKNLSIQLSSDGFSFCVYNTKTAEYENLVHSDFSNALTNPALLLNEVKNIFETNELLHQNYGEINLIHHNNLNTFVPNNYFDEDLLPNYLENTVKTFKNDFISYDDLDPLSIKNVYIPFVNVNNYIFDSFGEFTYLHSSTVFLNNIYKQFKTTEKAMFVNVYKQDYQLFVLKNQTLELYNHFSFKTTEDFVYYILFTSEQLKMDANKFELHLFGTIYKEDAVFKLLYKYVRNVYLYNDANEHVSEKINSLPQENYNLLQFYL